MTFLCLFFLIFFTLEQITSAAATARAAGESKCGPLVKRNSLGTTGEKGWDMCAVIKLILQEMAFEHFSWSIRGDYELRQTDFTG